MANDEQRRAFASYMGRSDSTAQNPGAAVSTGNPYLFQQFPGLQGVPTAPTPPPAASPSLASVAGYQGVTPGFFPQTSFSPGGFGQGGYPQRPPPLGQNETMPGQQAITTAAIPPGFADFDGHNNQALSLPSYNAGWAYPDPSAQQSARLRGEPARSAMMPSSRNATEVVESRSKHMREHYHYQQYGQPSSSTVVAPIQIEEQKVPVLLCHTCSVCGRMRSAGYHRNNPVIPGKPVVPTPCRRCKKKERSYYRSDSRYTRVRSCTADEPCAWPRESIRIDIDQAEHRGRPRDREDMYYHRDSPSRPRIIRQKSSQANIGLRALQNDDNFTRAPKPERRIRMSSLSPGRASRYDEIWPLPDIVRMRPARTERPSQADQRSLNITSRDEVWPPPDVVSTHDYRNSTRPLRRQSSRIIELSPSPPPRTRSTRVMYRSMSRERRVRSVSPPRVRTRNKLDGEDAEDRMRSHPRPYRPVLPDQRSYVRVSDETLSNDDSMLRDSSVSPRGGILKVATGDFETSRRRMSTRESQQSTAVEVGGPRVRFGSDLEEQRGRPRFVEESRISDRDHERYRDYSRQRYVDERPPAVPIDDLKRMRIQRSPPSPQGSYDEERRTDRARRLSPSPVATRRADDIRVRYVSSPSPRDRERAPRLPHSPERPIYVNYRHISQSRSVNPPPLRKPASDDTSDSDSVRSGEVTEVRSWRGVDENGNPATFIEEKRSTRLLEQGSDRGSGVEFRPVKDKVERRYWRDV